MQILSRNCLECVSYGELTEDSWGSSETQWKKLKVYESVSDGFWVTLGPVRSAIRIEIKNREM